MSRLLLIEDRESLLRSLKTLLELEGYKVFTATTQESVEEILERKAIDLVLLDVNFHIDDGKQIKGYEILETIRRTPEWHDIRVLMTSGEDFRDQALQAGADGFLLKPYLPEKLVNLVQLNLEENEK
ncbi:MAG: response regulator [Anaerolineales bacterium]